MLMRHWSGVLRLLSLTTIADGRVRDEELRVFAHRLMALRERVAPDMMFSERMVHDWFEAHRDEMAELSDRDRASAVEATLAGLDDLDTRADLVDAVNAVARADGHRHAREMEILQMAAERWKTSIPKR